MHLELVYILEELDDSCELRFQEGYLELVNIHVQLNLRLGGFLCTRWLVSAQLLDPCLY